MYSIFPSPCTHWWTCCGNDTVTTWKCIYIFKILTSFLKDKYPRMGLLITSHMIVCVCCMLVYVPMHGCGGHSLFVDCLLNSFGALQSC